jgi:hypothetical protein
MQPKDTACRGAVSFWRLCVRRGAIGKPRSRLRGNASYPCLKKCGKRCLEPSGRPYPGYQRIFQKQSPRRSRRETIEACSCLGSLKNQSEPTSLLVIATDERQRVGETLDGM